MRVAMFIAAFVVSVCFFVFVDSFAGEKHWWLSISSLLGVFILTSGGLLWHFFSSFYDLEFEEQPFHEVDGPDATSRILKLSSFVSLVRPTHALFEERSWRS